MKKLTIIGLAVVVIIAIALVFTLGSGVAKAEGANVIKEFGCGLAYPTAGTCHQSNLSLQTEIQRMMNDFVATWHFSWWRIHDNFVTAVSDARTR